MTTLEWISSVGVLIALLGGMLGFLKGRYDDIHARIEKIQATMSVYHEGSNEKHSENKERLSMIEQEQVHMDAVLKKIQNEMHENVKKLDALLLENGRKLDGLRLLILENRR